LVKAVVGVLDNKVCKTMLQAVLPIATEFIPAREREILSTLRAEERARIDRPSGR
jgi:hypothetical protein